MNNKKIFVLVGVIVVVIIAVIAFLSMSKKDGTVEPPPPSINNTDTPPSALSDTWESYQSDVAKYGISLPKAWFIDQDSIVGGGVHLTLSNNQDLDVSKPETVVVEIFPQMTKKSGETLFAAIKAKGKTGGNFGKTKAGATDTGYEMFGVEHAYGNATDGPGYAIARSKTEYMFIVASNQKESEVLESIVTSVVFLK